MQNYEQDISDLQKSLEKALEKIVNLNYEKEQDAAEIRDVKERESNMAETLEKLKQKFDELFKISKELTKENHRLKQML